MESGAPDPGIDEASNLFTWKRLIKEVKKVSLLAAPMITVAILQYMVQVVALMIVGRLGELPLASVSIALSVTNISGFSLFIGLCGGLDTLCGQAYGAKQYEKIGTYIYSAIISLLFICVPISLLWIFMDKVLILIGQDHQISVEAQKFAVWLIPGLVASAFYDPLVRFLQCQSLVFPLLMNFAVVLGITTLSCWISVYKLNYGIQSVAFSLSLCGWLNVMFLGIYIKCSSVCEKTRTHFSKEAFYNIWPFLRFGFPAALMICLKWWAFEAVVLLSGRLPNPQLETSVLSICLNISTLLFTVPVGLGVSVGIRVANELGAGNAEAARLSAWVVTSAVVIETFVAGVILFCVRHIVGYAYSHTEQVVSYVATLAPFLCLSIITDGLQMVLSGVAKGSGWQRIGAYVNLGAFYIVGIPVAVVLAFVRHLNAKGLWIGILVGSILQSILLIIVAALTNWQKQAIKARDRAAVGNAEQRTNNTQ
ncbi:protein DETOXIFICATION 14-like [Chenopodium quinoa]|uniref:protein DETOXIFICATION 14-like n=1 Tax=Chenopodium quinoa TaxID=63459 RepID=UPI000B782A7B|nr:protein DETOXIFICATION 14-like [Chenopodium quinoa]